MQNRSEQNKLKIKPLNRSYDALSGLRPLTRGGTAPHRSSQGGTPNRTGHSVKKVPHAAKKNYKYTMHYVALAGWILLLAAVFVTGIAQPQTETYYHRRHHVKVEQFWNYDLTPYILTLCILALAVSITGLTINLVKSHPKGDFVHINFIILAALSLTGIVLYFVYLT